MLRARSIGPKMIEYLEHSGIQTFDELAARDAESLLLQIHVETGIRLNRMGLEALANLVALAKQESGKQAQGQELRADLDPEPSVRHISRDSA